MLRKILTTTISVPLFFNAIAQVNNTTTSGPSVTKPETETDNKVETPKPKPILTGYVDAYYRFNFSNPQNSTNNFTSFTNSQNSFELGMASLKVEHTIGKVGMVADIGFGKRAEEFSYNDVSTKVAIKQAYVTYSPGKIKFTLGSWATHVGYELVDPYLNRNYSMSYMFSYGPFFHTGVKAETTIGKHGFMFGVANPTDLKSANFSTKMVIGQYSVATKNDKIKAYLNYMGGKPNDSLKMNQFDLTATGTISSKFSVGVNGTVASFKNKIAGKYSSSNSWWGSALYLNLDPTSWLGFTLRSEYFDDKKQLNVFAANATKGGTIFANTFSTNFKIDNLTIIPEFRLENASEAIYATKTSTSKSTASFILAAIYKF